MVDDTMDHVDQTSFIERLNTPLPRVFLCCPMISFKPVVGNLRHIKPVFPSEVCVYHAQAYRRRRPCPPDFLGRTPFDNTALRPPYLGEIDGGSTLILKTRAPIYHSLDIAAFCCNLKILCSLRKISSSICSVAGLASGSVGAVSITEICRTFEQL
jgi:hypothetical protein